MSAYCPELLSNLILTESLHWIIPSQVLEGILQFGKGKEIISFLLPFLDYNFKGADIKGITFTLSM